MTCESLPWCALLALDAMRAGIQDARESISQESVLPQFAGNFPPDGNTAIDVVPKGETEVPSAP